MNEKPVYKFRVRFDSSIPIGHVRCDDFLRSDDLDRVVWIHPDMANDIESVKEAIIRLKRHRDN